MLDGVAGIGEYNGSYYSLSTYFSDFFEAIQSTHRSMSTRKGMFFAGLRCLDLKSLFSKVCVSITNKIKGLVSVQWAIYR